MRKKIFTGVWLLLFSLTATACSASFAGKAEDSAEDRTYESVEERQIKMTTDHTEVVITLNGSRAAADLAGMLPLGHAEHGAETMADETGTVRLELIEEEGEYTEHEETAVETDEQ